MNKVDLVGRLTKDPDIRYTNGGLSIASFTLAVDRKYKREGEPTADFISCKAFGKTSEFIEKYFHKGMRMGACGRIQTGNYTKDDGTKVYTTDVICEEVEFVENKQSSDHSEHKAEAKAPADDFMDIPDGFGDELPFN